MNHYQKLEQLRTNVWYWKGIFEESNPSNARTNLAKLNSARELLKAFKRDNMPYLLEQPKNNFKQHYLLQN